MNSCIVALGTATPEFRIAQEEILRFMIRGSSLDENQARRLAQIYQNSGIECRHSVLPDFAYENPQQFTFFPPSADLEPFPTTAARQKKYRQKAVGLACAAALDCLDQTDHRSEITHLITVSCTGMYAPGLDIDLIENLGLKRSTERTCINFMGCYGAINALKSADYICRAEPKARVLIVCTELCTLHFQKHNTIENWVANSIFADGAAAVLVEGLSSGKTGLAIENFYAEYLYDARHEMGWIIGDTGFEMQLTGRVPQQISANIRSVAEKLLAKTAPPPASLHYAIHPGGKKILEAAQEALAFLPEMNAAALETLRDYGNMSSATLLFVLKKILQNKPGRGGHLAAFAFGPGLTVESVLLRRT